MRIFVRKVPKNVTEPILRDAFRIFGEIDEVEIPVDRYTLKPRGFVYITFRSSQSAEEACRRRSCKVMDADVEILESNQNKRHSQETQRLYISGIPSEENEDEILKFFQGFGRVITKIFPKDKNNGKLRNFCFIAFSSDRISDELLERKTLQYKDFVLRIDKAKPRDELYPDSYRDETKSQKPLIDMSAGEYDPTAYSVTFVPFDNGNHSYNPSYGGGQGGGYYYDDEGEGDYGCNHSYYNPPQGEQGGYYDNDEGGNQGYSYYPNEQDYNQQPLSFIPKSYSDPTGQSTLQSNQGENPSSSAYVQPDEVAGNPDQSVMNDAHLPGHPPSMLKASASDDKVWYSFSTTTATAPATSSSSSDLPANHPSTSTSTSTSVPVPPSSSTPSATSTNSPVPPPSTSHEDYYPPAERAEGGEYQPSQSSDGYQTQTTYEGYNQGYEGYYYQGYENYANYDPSAQSAPLPGQPSDSTPSSSVNGQSTTGYESYYSAYPDGYNQSQGQPQGQPQGYDYAGSSALYPPPSYPSYSSDYSSNAAPYQPASQPYYPPTLSNADVSQRRPYSNWDRRDDPMMNSTTLNTPSSFSSSSVNGQRASRGNWDRREPLEHDYPSHFSRGRSRSRNRNRNRSRSRSRSREGCSHYSSRRDGGHGYDRYESRDRDGAEESCRVFVQGLDPSVTEDIIRDHFSPYGKILHVKLPKNHETGRQRDLALITMDSPESVDRAVANASFVIMGKRVKQICRAENPGSQKNGGKQGRY